MKLILFLLFFSFILGKAQTEKQEILFTNTTLELHQVRINDTNLLEDWDQFLNSQIKLLTLDSLIQKVAKKSKIDYFSIKKGLNVTRIPNTNLLEISLQLPRKPLGNLDAGKNTIKKLLEIHNESRAKRIKMISENRINIIDSQLIDLSDLIQDSRRELTILIQQANIPLLPGKSLYQKIPQIEIESEKQKSLELTLLSLELRKKRITTQLDLLNKMPEQERSKIAMPASLEGGQIFKLKITRESSTDLMATLKIQKSLIDQEIKDTTVFLEKTKKTLIELSLKQLALAEILQKLESSRTNFNRLSDTKNRLTLDLQMPNQFMTIHNWKEGVILY